MIQIVTFGAILQKLMIQEEAIYEEEEVVWAKLQGHPYWPAYIDRIDFVNQTPKYQVVFFGEYSNCWLDGSKIQKYYENYEQFYRPALRNKELMRSIDQAQKQLKLNGYDVSIYQQQRQQLTRRRRKVRQKSITESSQQVSKQANQQSFDNSSVQSKPGFSQMCQQPNQQQLLRLKHLSELVQEEIQSKRRQRKIFQDQQLVHQKDQRQVEMKQCRNMQQTKQQKTIILKSCMDVQNVQMEAQKAPFSSSKTLQSQSQPINQKHVSEASIHQHAQSYFASSPTHFTQDQITYQPKIFSPIKEPQDEGDCSDKRQNAWNQKTKQIRKSFTKYVPTLIDMVKGVLSNREELINLLSNSPIDVHNITDILDLNVIQILQKGPEDIQVNNLLSLFEHTLHLKYFPYTQKNSLSTSEIRTKTAIKIKNYLNYRRQIQQSTAVRQISKMIESLIYQKDQLVGETYCQAAREVIHALGDPMFCLEQMIQQLKQ